MLDRWKLQDFAPGAGLLAGAAADDFDHSAWIDVAVPGDVHRALIAAGRIPDPFYDRNESECAWMEEREFWYRTRFTAPSEPPAPDERMRLVFHGLDTFATVWLNGEELGTSRNMFREAVFDVGVHLRRGQQNTLAVRFDAPLTQIGEIARPRWDDRDLPRVAMRKAQFGYGWDWGPRLPTIGIWRPVELHRQRGAALAGVHFATMRVDRATGSALVAIAVEVDRISLDGALTAAITLAQPAVDGLAQPPVEHTLVIDRQASSARAYLTVEQAQLWWTHDLGARALYDLDVRLLQDGELLDQAQSKVGIRTIELDQSPDPEEPGTRFFRFVLNGTPIFAKGANWIPADSFVGAISSEQYEMLLTAARDGNMNMLRVWGGGIYEHDVFYDLCDRLGLLIWQDFMFACAPYPETDATFNAEVAAEAQYQVRRLRSHPCLALWCGNNENQWMADQRRWDHPGEPVPGALFYNHTLPAAVASQDGFTPYWLGSPYGGNDYNSQEDGDRHNWDVWHGKAPRRFGEPVRVDQSPAGVSYRRYADDQGRFLSEFGMHAAPMVSTLRRVIPEDQLYHHSPSMDHHNKDNPKNKGDNLMLTVTGLPRDLAEYLDFSMIAQAEGLKFGVEHFRRRMPHCSGTLVWQLNDCWPVLSWSVVDYFGVPKAGYHYLKRAYAPLLASFKEQADGGVELWLTNDSGMDVRDTLSVSLWDFNGTALWNASVSAQAPAGTSRLLRSWSSQELGAGADRFLAVASPIGTIAPNRHFFVPIKDLQRVRPDVEVMIAATGERTLRIGLSCRAFAYFVVIETPGGPAHLSDNYFDLYPGERYAVTLTDPVKAPTPEGVAVRWR